ncbi:unnamed protein product [Effrenium voratum]|nr:unnamed protein product [Effrenium voratum]
MGAAGSKKSKINRYVDAEDAKCEITQSASLNADWETMMYLSRFGYGVANPVMSLSVEQVMEREGHRKYELRCALRLPEKQQKPCVPEKQQLQVEPLFDVLPMTWTCWKRLYELREQLYEPVKECLGSAYGAHFADTPFALRISLTGTLERLDAWAERLALLASDNKLHARCMALILRFLEAPAPEEAEDGMLKPKANLAEKQLTNGDTRCFVIREWRSDWQLELKTKLLQLGAGPEVWQRHVAVQDDSGAKLAAKCREDGYPYVTFVDGKLKGQPIRFPVTVHVDASVLSSDRWAEPAECVDFSALIRPRNPERCSAMEYKPVAPGVSVARLFEWIDGPLARGWQPYSLVGANCQHFSEELHEFLQNPAKVERQSEAEDIADILRVVSQQVTTNPKMLSDLPPHLSKERSVVLRAVHLNGMSLAYVEKQFQQDWRVVLSAVQQDGDALRFASEEMKSDRQIVLAAVQNKGAALQHADKSLHRDREMLLAAGWSGAGVLMSWSSDAS